MRVGMFTDDGEVEKNNLIEEENKNIRVEWEKAAGDDSASFRAHFFSLQNAAEWEGKANSFSFRKSALHVEFFERWEKEKRNWFYAQQIIICD